MTRKLENDFLDYSKRQRSILINIAERLSSGAMKTGNAKIVDTTLEELMLMKQKVIRWNNLIKKIEADFAQKPCCVAVDV